MTLDSLPDLECKRAVSCKDSFHGTDVLAVSEHGAPGRRPNIHAHFVGRQREDGLDTLPARAAEANRSTLSPWKRRSQAVRKRKTGVLRACRVPNPAKRLNVVQRPKTLFEPQRSMTSRSQGSSTCPMRLWNFRRFSSGEPRDAPLCWPSRAGTGVFPTGTYLASGSVLSIASLPRSHSCGPPSPRGHPLSPTPTPGAGLAPVAPLSRHVVATTRSLTSRCAPTEHFGVAL